jgi:hypothetical protein
MINIPCEREYFLEEKRKWFSVRRPALTAGDKCK